MNIGKSRNFISKYLQKTYSFSFPKQSSFVKFQNLQFCNIVRDHCLKKFFYVKLEKLRVSRKNEQKSLNCIEYMAEINKKIKQNNLTDKNFSTSKSRDSKTPRNTNSSTEIDVLSHTKYGCF